MEDGSVRGWRSKVWTGSGGGIRVEVVIGEVVLWMCWTGGKQELGWAGGQLSLRRKVVMEPQVLWLEQMIKSLERCQKELLWASRWGQHR